MVELLSMFGQESRSVALVGSKILDDGVEKQSVKDVLRFAPRPASDCNTPALVVEALGVVGVAVDHEGNAELAGAVGVGVLEIETSRGRVDFERGSGLGRGLEDGFEEVTSTPETSSPISGASASASFSTAWIGESRFD